MQKELKGETVFSSGFAKIDNLNNEKNSLIPDFDDWNLFVFCRFIRLHEIPKKFSAGFELHKK